MNLAAIQTMARRKEKDLAKVNTDWDMPRQGLQ